MSLFDELKRRNVFRVGIAYVVVAWLVAQVVDLVLENFGAPAWFMRSLLVILAAGLPLAIIFAWAFEMTPDGIKKESEVDRSQSVTSQTGRKLDRIVIGVMALVITLLVIDRFVLSDEDTAAVQKTDVTTDAEPLAAKAETGPSIAVLPFVNMSGDANNEYFSDGLTETLLHMLAQLPELRVAARTSSFSFKGKDTGIAEIGEMLGVAHILEGSVQKAGNRVRVTAQLIRADDGFHVWSQNYDRTLDDIFAIQDEIASDVAQALDSSLLGSLSSEIQGVSTHDTEAYDFYLHALEQQAVFTYQSLGKAEALLKNALAIDPGFVDAKLALARNYQMKAGTGVIDWATARLYTQPLLDQVDNVKPGDPLARALRLSSSFVDSSTAGNEETRQARITELRELLPKIPADIWVRISLVNALVYYQAYEDGLDVIQDGLILDPLSATLYSGKSYLYTALKQFENAHSALMQAKEIDPGNPLVYSALAELSFQRGNLTAGLNWQRQSVERDPQDHELPADIARDLFYLELTEEGAHWAGRCYALAPQSGVCRSIQLSEARARDDLETSLQLATAMLVDGVEVRRGGFGNALFTYVDLMIDQGRVEDAYAFLESIHPDISAYETPPANFKQIMLRRAGAELMMRFAPRDQYVTALNLLSEHEQAMQLSWMEQPHSRVYIHLLHGELEQAKAIALTQELAEDTSMSLNLASRYQRPLYRELAQQPEVAARLRERAEEMTVLRAEVQTMLLEPEWNQ